MTTNIKRAPQPDTQNQSDTQKWMSYLTADRINNVDKYILTKLDKDLYGSSISPSILWQIYKCSIRHFAQFLGNQVHIKVNDIDGYHNEVWTDHGPCHAYNVAKIASRLAYKIDNIKLNALEVFILQVACWVHDLGMFVSPPGLSKAQQRKYHGRLCSNVLLNTEDTLFKSIKNITDSFEEDDFYRLLNCISLVAAAHQSKYPLNTIKEEILISNIIKTSLKSLHSDLKNNGIIRLRLLGALLRLADAYHIHCNRTNDSLMELMMNEYGQPSDISFFEWIINRCVSKHAFNKFEAKYYIEISDHLIDPIVECKKKGGSNNEKDYKEEIKDGIYETVKDYIASHIANHVISLGGSNAIPEMDEYLKKLTIVYVKDKNKSQKKIDPILERRGSIYRAFEKKKSFWINAVNGNRDTKIIIGDLRSKLRRTNHGCEIFLFLIDYENDNILRLYENKEIYNGKVEEGKKLEKWEKMKNVLIPLKCGIAGYVGWSGEKDFVGNLAEDWRETYQGHDAWLKLKGVYFLPLPYQEKTGHKQKNEIEPLQGVILFDSKKKRENWDILEHNDIKEKLYKLSEHLKTFELE